MSESQELRVADLMTRSVCTLSASQSLPLAEALMRLARIRHVPVIDEEGGLVGLVTHRDLLSAQISALTPLTEDERSSLQLVVPVSKIMQTDVWTIAPQALAVSAARIMRDHRFGCLPVVEEGKLVGILTESDLLALVTDALALDKPRTMTVADAMTASPVTIDLTTTIADAMALMTTHRCHHLPVVDGDRCVSMISARDLHVADIVFRGTQNATAFRASRLVSEDGVLRAKPTDPLDRIFSEMFERRVDAALVEDGGRVVGVLSAADACRITSEHVRRVRKTASE